ncbi:flagellar protein FlaG [Marinibactrum halimedae]|uniref:Flagellar protein FlaG n=1 Tax=Marinibactrum halimedae TaxID=1444977 RepID=A0AA37T7Z9_9GAMM|nr:flagellar protein FlaG [Marinibactrum halimedae]MCD9460867.1 flagellar protein FlaG [Marinibactrum halimedae]GLS27354.1 hypothetical protein GCM10007877_30730 [Marinibactrum halimedae]
MDIQNVVNVRPASSPANAPGGSGSQARPVADSINSSAEQAVSVTENENTSALNPAEEAEEVAEQSREQIEAAVADLNQFVQSIRRDLSFSLQDETGNVVVDVTDSETGELIRRIPSEEALELSRRMDEMRSLMTSVEA